MKVCDLVDRLLDKIKCLGLESHHWSCLEVSGKLLIPYCLRLLSSRGCLVDKNCV